MRKIKIIMVIIVFILSFPIHFMYEWFPGFLTSIFFPVNESIWEHMKIIYTSILFSSVIEYFIYKFNNIKVNNFILSIPLISIIGIIVYLIIYLLIDRIIPHNLFVSITLLLLIFIFCEFMSYKLLTTGRIRKQRKVGIILIIISYMIFAYFTYNPSHNYIFLDTQTNSYGIKK